MLIISVTVEDTDSKRKALLTTFVVEDGYHHKNETLHTPIIDKNGLVLYTVDILTLASDK